MAEKRYVSYPVPGVADMYQGKVLAEWIEDVDGMPVAMMRVQWHGPAVTVRSADTFVWNPGHRKDVGGKPQERGGEE